MVAALLVSLGACSDASEAGAADATAPSDLPLAPDGLDPGPQDSAGGDAPGASADVSEAAEDTPDAAHELPEPPDASDAQDPDPPDLVGPDDTLAPDDALAPDDTPEPDVPPVDVGPITGGSPGQPTYVVTPEGCAIPDEWESPGCAGVTCGSDERCVGQGECVPSGSFFVDPDGPARQSWPAVATRDDGAFAVVYTSGEYFEGTQKGVLRVFSPDAPLGTGPVAWSDDAPGESERAPSVTAMLDGSWLVMWRSEQVLSDANRYRARRFLADGSGPADDAFEVNTTPLGALDGGTNAIQPLVVRLRNDDLIMAWSGSSAQGQRAYARLFDAEGSPNSGELTVSSALDGAQASSVGIARLPAGVALVVWQETIPGAGKNTQRVFGRVVKGTGDLGPILGLSPGAVPYEALPSAGAYDDGAVVLTRKSGANADSTSAVEVLGLRVPPGLQSATEAPPTDDAVQLDLDSDGSYPSAAPVAVLSPERAVAVWHDQGQSMPRIWLRRHYAQHDVWDCERTDAGGDWLGPEAYLRFIPGVAAWPDGHFVVVYTTQVQGTDAFRVAARVFPW